MASSTTLIFAIFAIVLGISESYKPCIDYKSVTLDEAFFMGVKKWHVIVHSGCENCEKDEDWKWLFGRTVPKKLCYKASAMIKGEEFTINFRCTYVEINTQECDMDTASLKGDKKVGLKGLTKIAGTDNMSWLALTSCIYGREQWWIILGAVPELPEAEIKKATDGLVALGFSTADNGREHIKFKTFEVMQC